MQKIIRQKKDGTFSLCAAKEENVGKKRCDHVPGGASFVVEVSEEKSGVIVDVPSGFEALDPIKKKAVILSFLDELRPCDKQEIEEVLARARQMRYE